MRVHELAKELGLSSKDLLAVLGEIGVGGLSASSTVPDGAISRLRASGGKAEPGAKKVKEAPVAEPTTAKPRASTSKPVPAKVTVKPTAKTPTKPAAKPAAKKSD